MMKNIVTILVGFVGLATLLSISTPVYASDGSIDVSGIVSDNGDGTVTQNVTVSNYSPSCTDDAVHIFGLVDETQGSPIANVSVGCPSSENFTHTFDITPQPSDIVHFRYYTEAWPSLDVSGSWVSPSTTYASVLSSFSLISPKPKIVFDKDDGSFYSANPDGTGITTLGTGAMPQTSPDGSKVVYSATNSSSTLSCGRHGTERDIYVMNYDVRV
ncbi:MAG: hypothetical protein ACREHC_02895 [Candidatus Levyibacteriota bacterium]